MSILKEMDYISMNQDYLFYDVKQLVVFLYDIGWWLFVREKVKVVGEIGYVVFLFGVE